MIYCPNCGTPNDDSSKICGKCGTSLSFPEPNQNFSSYQQNSFQTPTPNNNKLLIILACIALGLASLGISLFFGLSRKDNSSSSAVASKEKTEDAKTATPKSEDDTTKVKKQKSSDDQKAETASSGAAKEDNKSAETSKDNNKSADTKKNDSKSTNTKKDDSKSSDSKKEGSGEASQPNKDFWNPTEHLEEAIDAYAAKIRKAHEANKNVHWCLVHVNGDVIPELVISDTFAHMCISLVYTFTEDGLTELPETGSDFGCFNFVPNQNRIISEDFVNGGYNYITVYEMKDGNAETLISFFEDQSIKGPAFEINKKPVSESSFNDEMNKYCKDQYHLEYEDMYPVFDGNLDKVQDLQEHYSYYLKE